MKVMVASFQTAALMLFFGGVAAEVQSGMLTAGDVDDNLNFVHYLAYKERTISNSSSQFLPNPILSDRVPIQVRDMNGDPYSCAVVQIGGQQLPAATNGRLWVFPSLDDLSGDPSSWNLVARAPEGSCPGDCSEEWTQSTTRSISPDILLEIPQVSSLPDKLDLALIVDTTGSMCDELAYLQAELRDIVQTVVGNTDVAPNVDVRLAILLYKDEGEIYVVQTTRFTDVDSAILALSSQTCGGGGDYPEAMVNIHYLVF
jgi:hypothetical protein